MKRFLLAVLLIFGTIVYLSSTVAADWILQDRYEEGAEDDTDGSAVDDFPAEDVAG
jgi:hypothetical protein